MASFFSRHNKLPTCVAFVLSCFILWQMWFFLTDSDTDTHTNNILEYTQYKPADSGMIKQHKQITASQKLVEQDGAQTTKSRNDVAHKNMTSHTIEMTSDAEFASRLARVQEVCNRGGVNGAVKSVLKMDKPKAIYCFVAKAGCTFWKSVYLRMKEKDGVTKDNLFTIPNLAVHERARMSAFSEPRDSTAHFPMRFLVTRDPFSRVVSAYLDKVYLPDFWGTEVKPMLESGKLRGGSAGSAKKSNASADFLREDLEKIQRLFGGETDFTRGLASTEDDAKCGKYATFSEFIQSGLDRQEPHWMPITSLCDPCRFKVTHVSHMETFTPDAVALLAKMGVHDVIDDFDRDSQVADQFRQLVDTNYEMTFGQANRRSFFSKCLTSRELAYRLWNHFRWRGYIHPYVDYVIPDVKDVASVKKDLMTQLHDSQQKANLDRKTVKAAKKTFMEDVFKSLPVDLFQRFLNKYKNDIDLFGYDHLRDTYSALHTATV